MSFRVLIYPMKTLKIDIHRIELIHSIFFFREEGGGYPPYGYNGPPGGGGGGGGAGGSSDGGPPPSNWTGSESDPHHGPGQNRLNYFSSLSYGMVYQNFSAT